MNTLIVLVFAVVYLGMIVGRIPGLAVDRTGVALLGAIAMVTLGPTPLTEAWAWVDMPTVYLLFAMMVISSQLRLAGFYTRLTERLVALRASPPLLLGLVVAAVGLLSAVLTNDIVCLAMAPVLVHGCRKRNLDPLPFLLALACASNVGSAATLIGNPQNILIGQVLRLSFGRFLLDAGVPALLGLGATWGIIAWQYRGRWSKPAEGSDASPIALGRWQALKGLGVTTALVIAFLFVHDVPREGIALTCAGLLLLSRRMASRDMLALVDWHLLVLFIGLFIVNGAFARTGAMDAGLARLADAGIDPTSPAALFGLSAILSNIVSNVPAVMLLLPSASHPLAGPVLALASTLAGNLFIVGSIANIIVVTSAQSLGVAIDFRTHARTGLPVTLATLALAALWLSFSGRGARDAQGVLSPQRGCMMAACSARQRAWASSPSSPPWAVARR